MSTLLELARRTPSTLSLLRPILALLVVCGPYLSAAELPDFRAELPRIPPSSPETALTRLHVAAGFRAELLAAEPLIVDPVAISFDAQGRLYAVEMRGYSEDPHLNLGRVRRLTDRDGDGRYDESTIFAEGFSWPTALLCYGDGVIVAAAPDLIYLRDTDDDGRADDREVLFRGFGRGNVQGLVNTLHWGLDQRIHGATSSAGATVTMMRHPERPPLELRGRDFAIDPRTWTLEPTTGGGQHGMSFNRWGDRFVCANSDHFQQIVYEDRYLTGHPDVSPLPARMSIASDGPQADVFRASPIEPWRIVRTRLRVAGAVPGPIEGGGRPAGYFTGATGITIYRGDAWPAEFLEYGFVCDVGSNLIHRKRLTDLGITYRADRVDEQTEFVRSEDIWFRPVQLANAPDGTLYVIDMCREVIEHPASLPPEIKQHLDLTSGRNRGRIYRIVPEGFAQRPCTKLAEQSSAGLVATLDHANGWHRDTAARLLGERQDSSVAAALQALAQNSQRPETRMIALHVLQYLNQLSSDTLLAALADPHPRVRCQALLLCESITERDDRLPTALRGLVRDPDPRVRFQLALTISRLASGEFPAEDLAQLLFSAADQPYLEFAAELAVGEQPWVVLQAVGAQQKMLESPAGRALLRRLAERVARAAESARAEDHPFAPLADQFFAWHTQHPIACREVAAVWLSRRHARLAVELSTGRCAPAVQELRTSWRKDAFSSSSATPLRCDAIRLLTGDPDPMLSTALYELLSPAEAPEIQQAALDTLAERMPEDLAETLLSAWPEQAPRLRSSVVDLLLTRKPWAEKLAERLDAGDVGLSDITASQRQVLGRLLGEAAWLQLVQKRQTAPEASSESLLATYRAALATQTPDVERGRQVFRRVCAACHRVDNEGQELGPNLAAMQNRGADAILLNVLEPNREVNPQYLAYVVETEDGRVLNGLIRQETSTSMDLATADGRLVSILRADIASLRNTGVSLMPTGLHQQITPAEMADLIGFLLTAGPR